MQSFNNNNILTIASANYCIQARIHDNEIKGIQQVSKTSWNITADTWENRILDENKVPTGGPAVFFFFFNTCLVNYTSLYIDELVFF